MDTPADVPREPADWRLRFVLAMLVFILGLAIGRSGSPFVGTCVSYIGYEIMARTDARGMDRVEWTIRISVSKPGLVWVLMSVGVVLGFVLAG